MKTRSKKRTKKVVKKSTKKRVARPRRPAPKKKAAKKPARKKPTRKKPVRKKPIRKKPKKSASSGLATGRKTGKKKVAKRKPVRKVTKKVAKPKKRKIVKKIAKRKATKKRVARKPKKKPIRKAVKKRVVKKKPAKKKGVSKRKSVRKKIVKRVVKKRVVKKKIRPRKRKAVKRPVKRKAKKPKKRIVRKTRPKPKALRRARPHAKFAVRKRKKIKKVVRKKSVRKRRKKTRVARRVYSRGGPLEQLFESSAKVQIMKLFFRNPEESLLLKEAAKIMRQNLAKIKREVKRLEKIGLLKVKQISSRKQLFSINPNFDFFEELRELILKSSPVSKERMLRAIRRLGKIKLVLLSGLFVHGDQTAATQGSMPHGTGRGMSRADLLIVGDNINQRKLAGFIKNLEAEAGTDIDCVVMSTEEFNYRYDMYDRFVRDLLSEKCELLINRLGL